MQVIGYIVVAIGAFLFCGNVFGFFHTFPLAGYLTMAVGGVIVRKAGK